MSLVDYNNAVVRRERELAAQQARPEGIRRTPEQQRAFENSDFMKKCRAHQLAVCVAGVRRTTFCVKCPAAGTTARGSGTRSGGGGTPSSTRATTCFAGVFSLLRRR